MFKPLIHFELVSLSGVRWGSYFIVPCECLVFPAPSAEAVFLSLVGLPGSLVEMSVDHRVLGPLACPAGRRACFYYWLYSTGGSPGARGLQFCSSLTMQALPWFCRNLRTVLFLWRVSLASQWGLHWICWRLWAVWSFHQRYLFWSTNTRCLSNCLSSTISSGRFCSFHRTDLSVPWINSSQLFVFDAIVNGTVSFLFQMLTISVKEHNWFLCVDCVCCHFAEIIN